MKQLLQHYDTGEVRIAVGPVPKATGVHLLVETRASVISAGTERALVTFGRSSLLAKARQQPDRVKQVLDKVRTDGVGATAQAIRYKLQQPTPLGYCSAGVVVETGSRVRGFSVGDHVATNGPHADHVRVPHTLAARIPSGVSFEHAAFTPLAAIALQGVRLAEPTLGETVVVYGLGLVGQLAVQLLRANGCRVIGVDMDSRRLELAHRAGAVSIDGRHGHTVGSVLAETDGVGADAVLLTLSSHSDDPVHEAALMSRTRGRLVLVGVTGLKLRRDDFFRKELSFRVSCSYGPGRYDPEYEDNGTDYPVGHVRWTEQRNFEAVLRLMSEGLLDPSPLVSHRFEFERAPEAYDLITGDAESLGVVLQYPNRNGAAITVHDRTVSLGSGAEPKPPVDRSLTAAFIGAGTFAQRVLIPAARAAGFDVHSIASDAGTSALLAAERFDASFAVTDIDAIIDNDAIGTVFVATRHDSHATLALRTLASGKNVFVEKPLALTHHDLGQLEQAARSSAGVLGVGFNRRFAPLTTELKRRLTGRRNPLALVITVNAGFLPRDHWTQDPTVGGGRIAGEACHFVDLARAIIGTSLAGGAAHPARNADGAPIDDIAHLTLSFADGSTAVVHYLANGSPSFPKERIEVFGGGETFVIDNWRRILPRAGGLRFVGVRRRQDKGHAAEMSAWAAAVRTGVPPVPYQELFEVSKWVLTLADAARIGGGTGAEQSGVAPVHPGWT